MGEMTRYANVDLVIKSDLDLSVLLAEFGERVIVLDPDTTLPRTEAALEIHHEGGPNGAINAFCDLVESLSGNARGIWNTCTERVFDVGFNAGLEPWPYRSLIKGPTLERAARIGATLVITIYPYREPKNETGSGKKIDG